MSRCTGGRAERGVVAPVPIDARPGRRPGRPVVRSGQARGPSSPPGGVLPGCLSRRCSTLQSPAPSSGAFAQCSRAFASKRPAPGSDEYCPSALRATQPQACTGACAARTLPHQHRRAARSLAPFMTPPITLPRVAKCTNRCCCADGARRFERGPGRPRSVAAPPRAPSDTFGHHRAPSHRAWRRAGCTAPLCWLAAAGEPISGSPNAWPQPSRLPSCERGGLPVVYGVLNRD